MNILFVVGFYPTRYSEWGGIFFHNFARGLVQLGHVVTVLRVMTQNRWEVKERGHRFIRETEWRDGVRVEICFFPKVPKFDFISRCLLSFFQKKVYKEVYKNTAPDIAHIHFSEMETSFVSARWLKKMHIPYVLTEHSTTFLKDSISPKLIKKAATVITGAKHVSAVGIQLAWVLERLFHKPVSIIPNGVDPEFFYPAPREPDGKIQFINVAVLVDKKNHTGLVRGFAQAFKDRPECYLTILGEGPERESIENEIQNQGLQDRVSLPGKATNTEVRDALQRSDFFVLPSKIETFGVVALEALFCGIPVLATISGGPENFIRQGQEGLLISKEERDLEKGLKDLLSYKWQRESIVAYARAHYSVKMIAGNLIKIYEEVLGVVQ